VVIASAPYSGVSCSIVGDFAAVVSACVASVRPNNSRDHTDRMSDIVQPSRNRVSLAYI
jgi:hypothetical protein